jgi:RNA polymerase-binding transcription factor DksA
MDKHVDYYRHILLIELGRARRTLDGLGKAHKEDLNNYDATKDDLDTSSGEREEVAGRIESFETRIGLEAELEKRLNEILAALAAIEAGTYGRCVQCGVPISDARLEANPTALTCINCAASLNISSTL